MRGGGDEREKMCRRFPRRQLIHLRARVAYSSSPALYTLPLGGGYRFSHRICIPRSPNSDPPSAAAAADDEMWWYYRRATPQSLYSIITRKPAWPRNFWFFFFWRALRRGSSKRSVNKNPYRLYNIPV